MCCDENGGVVDDLIAYLRSDDDVFLVPNAANTAEVVRRLRAAAPDGVEVTDQHEQYGVLAVQGPRSDEVLQALGLPTGHDYMSFVDADWQGRPVVVCRTGYTGERGYELRPALGGHAGPVGRADRGGRGVRRPALRPGRARHAAHRDGLPAARPRPQPRHHAGPGARRVGRRVEEGRLLGPGGAGRREGRRCAPHLLGAARHRTRHPARALPGEGRPTARWSARSPPARSPRR